jgi:serine/threonine protein kinase
MNVQLVSQLETLLDADVGALLIWFDVQKSNARAISSKTEIKRYAEELLSTAQEPGFSSLALAESPAAANLNAELSTFLDAHNYTGFGVIAPTGVVLASHIDELVGKTPTNIDQMKLKDVLDGNAVISRPIKSAVSLSDIDGKARAGVPVMIAAAPIVNDADEVIAMLALQIRPEDNFSKILSTARAGITGETYAFDIAGTLISQSRFDDQLKQIGLIPDNDLSRSILSIQIRDPGVDMTRGERPSLRRSQQPLTRMARDAVDGKGGVDVSGYRDYRGVPVVGAWTWLPDYGFGVATELDVAEAFRPLLILRSLVWGLFALLAFAAIAIFVFSIIVSRLNRTAREAALEAKQLGQYTLEEKVGEGGMGVVYRAKHALLRRPTAVKLLATDRTTPDSIARFEREVQLTSRLNHPNTIAIYDYGKTSEGVFYYAMEFLDGVNLEDLVERYGAIPEGRTIAILRQVCGSLTEAHGIGLIHRDIKPANIIINRRAGMFDVVKLIDFGIVKAVDSKKLLSLTADGSWTGTPLYLSPESIQRPDQVDARSDLYALGAVGYFLLTGTPVFNASSLTEICDHQIRSTPELPSKRMNAEVSCDLEQLILKCLLKDPAERPQTAEELAKELDYCASATAWTNEDAAAWWDQNLPVAQDDASGDEIYDSNVFAETVLVDSSNGLNERQDQARI